MAIMHLSVKNGAKGKGAAHAQYIEREGKYAQRKDKILSESGNMPVWAQQSPREFWKAADQHERANGRSYRELEISLPRELTTEQQTELVREFTKNVLGESHAYTWAIHEPKARDGELNSHVHLMFSERTNDGIERDQSQYFKRYNRANPELGGAGKDRYFTSRYFVNAVREEWAQTVNERMHELGIDARIDHRSYKELGIDLQSQNIKMIVANSNNVDKTITYEMDTGKLRDKQRANGEQIIAEPTIALDALTSKSSTFTKRDVQKFLMTHTDGADQFTEAYNRVLGSLHTVNLEGERMTTSEMRAVEQSIIDRVERMQSAPKTQNFSDRMSDIKDQKTFDKVLNEMHQRSHSKGRVVEAEQEQTYKVLTSKERIVSVNGAAGTGKSFVLESVNDAYKRAGYNVQGLALQGVTAESMERDSGIQSRTFTSMIDKLDAEQEQGKKSSFNNKTVIMIDEAGMVGSRDMERILAEAEKQGSMIRMVGDQRQLNAVSAGASFERIQDTLNDNAKSELKNIVRQNDEQHREASRAFAKHDIESGLKTHEKLGNIKGHATIDEARNHVVAQWAKANKPKISLFLNMQKKDIGKTNISSVKSWKSKTKIMLAHTRADVKAMNASARDIMREQGNLKGEDVEVMTTDGKIKLAQGEQIAFGKPNKQIGVVNGTRGTVQSIEQTNDGQMLNVQVGKDEKDIKRVNLNEYKDITHNYATTVHKAQGVTVDRAYVLASDSMSANLTYVANTRHKEELQIHYSKEQFKDIEDMGRKLSKAEEKTFSADYEVLRDVKHLDKEKARETLSERRESTQKLTGKEMMEKPIEERRAAALQQAREKSAERQQENSNSQEMQKGKGFSHGM